MEIQTEAQQAGVQEREDAPAQIPESVSVMVSGTTYVVGEITLEQTEDLLDVIATSLNMDDPGDITPSDLLASLRKKGTSGRLLYAILRTEEGERPGDKDGFLKDVGKLKLSQVLEVISGFLAHNRGLTASLASFWTAMGSQSNGNPTDT